MLPPRVAGFTLKFLNDPTWMSIKSKEELDIAFIDRQLGGTPLCANLRAISDGMSWRKNVASAKPEGETIVIVMTDGNPSDGSFSTVASILRGRSKAVYCTFLMCTDEDAIVDKYNRTIDPIFGCDISDDFHSEKKEVERAGNKLNQNKWLAKCVLGGKMPKYDNMDSPNKACCLIM